MNTSVASRVVAAGARVLVVSTCLLILGSSHPARADGQLLPSPAPYCSDPTPPSLDFVFGGLAVALAAPIGEAVECAHPVLSGDALVQRFSSGAFILNATSGQATFTDGVHFWTLGAEGSLDTTDVPPPGVVPALLVTIAPPPSATPAPTVASVQVAGVSATRGPTSAPTANANTSVFRADPRLAVPLVSDLPDGGERAWTPLGDTTNDLFQGRYSIMFGKRPSNGAPFPLDPILLININATDSIESAQTAWKSLYSQPGPGQRAGVALAPFAEDQFYALAPNVLDVRGRFRNVIFQVVETTPGQGRISVDDAVGLVRIMQSRVGSAIH